MCYGAHKCTEDGTYKNVQLNFITYIQNSFKLLETGNEKTLLAN